MSEDSTIERTFSGEPLTRWVGPREMTLEEDFYYVDSGGRKWLAPRASCINGATIPRALWSIVGSPYTGKYRKASVVHDYAVGELCNPDATFQERRHADHMFYDACLAEGCTRGFSRMLYVGVRLGSWMSLRNGIVSDEYSEPPSGAESIELAEFSAVIDKFNTLLNSINGIVELSLEDLDKALDELLPVGIRQGA